MVGFVRDNNLYVTDLATGAETALTTDGGENVINGTSDWVYEEELDLRDAFHWSPDGRRIAFWRFDQTAIRPFYLVDHDSRYPALVPVRYPKTGTPNSTVKIGVTEVASGRTSWVDLGADKEDRKSTRLNSSHTVISYAVFCLKKKKKQPTTDATLSRPSKLTSNRRLARR